MRTDIIPRTTLYPFQRSAVERAKAFDGRCLLAMDAGTGKTLTSITYMVETASFPAVIVCPASLKYNWANELRKHYGLESLVIDGTNTAKYSRRLPTDPPIYIINYDILYAYVDFFQRIQPKLVILDECHYIKSLKARRTKACAVLAYASDRLLGLSGTPLTRMPSDLYPLLNCIFKGQFVSLWTFEGMYCTRYKSRFGWKITGTKNEKQLNDFLTERCMIRYKIEDVLPDLPPFIRQTTLLEMTNAQKREYRQLTDEFCEWLQTRYPDRKIPRSEEGAVVAKMGYMKRQVAEWKIPSIIESVEDFLNGSDGKLLVFAIHTKVMDGIWEAFGSKGTKAHPLAVRIDGSTPAKMRDANVQRFQNDPSCRLFLGQIVASGTGLTLTASHHTIFAEVDFLPVTHTQAEARNRRIGQGADFVHYNYILMKDTIEEHVCQTLFDRQKVIDTVIDGRGVEEEGTFNLASSFIRDHVKNFGLIR